MALYDTIGLDYAQLRRPDPRIQAVLHEGLGGAARVVNVGAGSGSYEPTDRFVVAVEPSRIMLRQRRPGAAPAVLGSGPQLPFRDASFDAALAILTLHHWPDQRGGLQELRRVARERVVVMTWDPAFVGFWLTDYFPELLRTDQEIFPALDLFADVWGDVEITSIPIPADCTDGFFGAYWRRPSAYLDERVRGAISTFSRVDAESGLGRLSRDLETGAWEESTGSMLPPDHLDLGYRRVVWTR